MSRFVSMSMRAYGSLLALYPADLRREFGADMLEAFAADLSAECAVHGIKGAFHIWRITLRELIRIALPAWLRVPAVTVSLLSAATFLVLQSPLLAQAIRRQAQESLLPGDATPLDALLALGVGAAVTALTAFVAVHRWKRASPISLRIG